MLLIKTYKFYAAHRNQNLTGKCNRPHGHRYGLECYFDVTEKRREEGPFNGAVPTPFEEIDGPMESMLKRYFDHRMFIDESDKPMMKFAAEMGIEYFSILPFPSSVENVAFFLFHVIRIRYQLPIVKLGVRETDSSCIGYDISDFQSDLTHFDLEDWISKNEMWQGIGD